MFWKNLLLLSLKPWPSHRLRGIFGKKRSCYSCSPPERFCLLIDIGAQNARWLKS